MPRSTKRPRQTTTARPQLPPQVRKMQQMRQQMQRKLPTMTAHARRTP
jgi:hypothetical protein